MDIVQRLSQSLSPWVGAHPVMTILITLTIGIALGKLIFNRKKKA
jgi:hypothetical protein